MSIWKVYDSDGRHVGDLEREVYGTGPDRGVILVVELIAFCLISYLSWNTIWLEQMNRLEFNRFSTLVGPNDGGNEIGLLWVVELWKSGEFSSKLEVVQLAASTLIPIIAGVVAAMVIGVRRFLGFRKFSFILGLMCGFVALLVAGLPFAILNCLIDRGFFAIGEMFSSYYFGNLGNEISLMIPFIVLAIFVHSFTNAWLFFNP